MQFLVLGGTQWVGRTIAATARRAGHSVTCLARGLSGRSADGARLIVRDRDDQYALRDLDMHWDAIVDVSRRPDHVGRAVASLSCGWFGFVSSTSVYSDLSRTNLDESAPTHAPLPRDSEMWRYGPAKVACEQMVRRRFGEGALIARVGLVGGPGDNSHRTTYWPWRFAHPSAPDGSVLVPAAADQLSELIDVRDFAAWIVRSAERRLGGTFNAAGTSYPLDQHLAAAREVAGHRGPVVEVDPDWLLARGVRGWMGPRSLPIWQPELGLVGLGAFNADAARATGLTTRPLRQTLAASLTAAGPGGPATWGVGLTDDEERTLLADWAANR